MASLLAMATAVSACAATSNDDVGSSAQSLSRKHVVHPDGTYFADITANGTGCPTGTWDAAISDDGETFTLRLNSYETTIAPGQTATAQDCQIDVKLGSADALSYSVATFHYQGYAILEKAGMTARQTAAYSFKGNPDKKADGPELEGPFDDSYLFTDVVGPSRRVWSHCNRDETLHVKTRLSLKNDPQKSGDGYLNASTVDGSLALSWKLNWRGCPHS
jgi:hypothetical protein